MIDLRLCEKLATFYLIHITVILFRNVWQKKAAFLPFSSILFRLYLYPLWSVSSKAFWTSQKRALSRRRQVAADDAGAPVSFPRLAAQLQMVLRPLFLLYSKHLRQQQYSNSSHELVYLYGHTSTHHGEKNKSLQGKPASQPCYCCSQGRSSQDARKLRQQFLQGLADYDIVACGIFLLTIVW